MDSGRIISTKFRTGINTVQKISRGIGILLGRAWFLPVIYFLVAAFLLPSRHLFEISTDEGINLIKALLVERGFPLYDEVWSDQPPLFTYLLVMCFRTIGYRVEILRLVVTFFSAVILWGSYKFLQHAYGSWQAVAGTVLVMLLPGYLILSISILIGLPAIAFAVLSLTALMYWHRKGKVGFIVLSAVILSLSILTKLFTVILAPVIVLGLIVSSMSNSAGSGKLSFNLKPGLVWLGSFVASLALIGYLMIGFQNVSQLVSIHFAASQADVFATGPEFQLHNQLYPSYPMIFLALITGVKDLLNRRWISLYPLTWMIAAIVFLSLNAPFWYHHKILITIPAAWLASDAILLALKWFGRLINQIRGSFQVDHALYFISLIAILSLLFSWKVPEGLEYFRSIDALNREIVESDQLDRFLLQKVISYREETTWILTDRPMFAYRASLIVPPEAAVLSFKRIVTGEINSGDLLDILKNYQPEQILFSRFLFPELEPWLDMHYTLVFSAGAQNLYYVRSDIVNSLEGSPALVLQPAAPIGVKRR